MNKKTNNLDNLMCLKWVLKMTMSLDQEIIILRLLKALYKYTDKFITIFSLADASSRR